MAVTLAFLIGMVVGNIKTQRFYREHIIMLYRLVHVLSTDCSPPANMMYDTVFEAGPKGKAPSETEMIEQYSRKNYERCREGVTKRLAREQDPGQIKKLDAMLEELDNMYTVMQTLTPDSSPEYTLSIMKELQASAHRMHELNSDDEDIGNLF